MVEVMERVQREDQKVLSITRQGLVLYQFIHYVFSSGTFHCIRQRPERYNVVCVWDAATSWTVHGRGLGAVQSLGILVSTENPFWSGHKVTPLPPHWSYAELVRVAEQVSMLRTKTRECERPSNAPELPFRDLLFNGNLLTNADSVEVSKLTPHA